LKPAREDWVSQALEHPDAVPVIRSFEGFYLQEYRSIVALARVLSGSASVAEDLAQEAFSAAYRDWSRVATFEHPNLWLRRVVANLSVSLFRRTLAEARARIRISNARPALESMPDVSEDVWDAVRRLPRRQAQAIALVYLDGLSVDEAGVVLECSAGTVKTHLKRGRSTLAKKLGEPVGGSG
jgi:RNA polymerase sigma-70 factor (ECF subfamily)